MGKSIRSSGLLAAGWPFNDFWLALLPVFGVNGSVLSGASGALQSTGALPGVFS
jgi:hypothetical protein